MSRRVTWDRHARRGLARLPVTVAPAVWEFVTGPLADNPERVGSRLVQPPFAGVFRAKRGPYVVLFDIDGDHGDRTVVVRRVEHRATVLDRPAPGRRPLD